MYGLHIKILKGDIDLKGFLYNPNQEGDYRVLKFITAVLIFLLGLLIVHIIMSKKTLKKVNQLVDERTTELNQLNHDLEKIVNDRTKDLQYQANYDLLTKLPNRTLFLDRLEHAISKADRKKSSLAILFIDLDRFKEINDSLGHEVGDQVLIKIANLFTTHFRTTDTVSRFGGDEFVVILEDITSIESIGTTVDALLNRLIEPYEIEDKTLYSSASIGISIYPDDALNSKDLLRNADSAMYKAKDAGKNNYQFYTKDMTEKAFERITMETLLRHAIKNDEFIVYYQPQINGENGTVIGLEALVRWRQPMLGVIAPDKFIPLAEETGLVIDLDRLSMKKIFAQMVQWRKERIYTNPVSVNLAVKQLESLDLFEVISSYLEETHCHAEWIEFEITEGGIMKNPLASIAKLQKLRAMGFKLSIDDFGTGYSSLAYLKKLPINKLKIDKSFVDELPINKDDIAITQSIIALAQNMNLNIIAEGVETVEQKEFLVQKGCSNIQGYLYSKPLSADELIKYLRNQNLIKCTS